MKESKNGVLIAIIIILLILLVASIFMIFKSNNFEQEEVSADLTNEMEIREEANTTIENETEENIIADNTIVKNEGITSSKIETSKNTELTNAEKNKIEQYIDIVCNRSKYYRLPEFTDINQADKVWLYGHINREKYPIDATENEIRNDLQELFGKDLIVNINKDIQNNQNNTVSNMPILYENNKYLLQAYGTDYIILYTINTIKKEKDYYIANVVEYCIQRDLEKNPDEDYIICAYSEKTGRNYNKIFDKSNATDEEVVNNVLKQKNKFQTYNIKITENNNGNFNVKEIKNVTK